MLKPRPDAQLTAGVRDPDDPTKWLVFPWPVDATFSEVVEHFHYQSVCTMWTLTSQPTPEQVATYYLALDAALDVASTPRLLANVDDHWIADMRTAVARCVEQYAGVRTPCQPGRVS